MNKQQKREKIYEDLYNAAILAADKAAEETVCTPMIVGSPSTPFGNDVDPNQKTYFVADGVCGFGWASIRPGTHPFAKWLVKTDRARKDSYAGGVTISAGTRLRTQSLTRNEAWAHAFAKVIDAVLGDHGVHASGQSRID